MKKIKIIIEKSSDSYGAYSENVSGIYGAGDTAETCKQSILDAIETIKTLDESQVPTVLKGNYEVVYKYDTISLLNYYKGIFSNSAFACDMAYLNPVSLRAMTMRWISLVPS